PVPAPLPPPPPRRTLGQARGVRRAERRGRDHRLRRSDVRAAGALQLPRRPPLPAGHHRPPGRLGEFHTRSITSRKVVTEPRSAAIMVGEIPREGPRLIGKDARMRPTLRAAGCAIALAGAVAGTPRSARAADPLPPGHWSVTWQDEFDGSTLNG